MAKDASTRSACVCECGNHAFSNLTRWGVTLVSLEDADLLTVPWHLRGPKSLSCAYAARAGEVSLHRQIAVRLSGKDWPLVDHQNGNGLDNRRNNLRECTHAQNMRNRTKLPRGKTPSKYKGVWFGRSAWRASIKVHGETVHLGTFSREDAAARQYDKAARVFFGKFAKTNQSMGLL